MGEATPKSLDVSVVTQDTDGSLWSLFKGDFLKYFGFILKRLLQHNPSESMKKNHTNTQSSH